MNSQFKIDFPSDKIKLNKIYQSKDSELLNGYTYTNKKLKEVYGDFSFPSLPKDRTYTLGSFVQSIDGKIAFPESPDGTLVAVLMGDTTIEKEPTLTGHVYDSELENARIKADKPAVPLHVIVSGDGSGFPVNHQIVTNPDIPLLIVTTEEGKKVLIERLDSSFLDLNSSADICLTNKIKGIVSLGSEGRIHLSELLKLLKPLGIDTMLIESPTFLVSLMGDALLDELYLNTSSIFIGGSALSLGSRIDSFTLDNHPHCKVVSIHTHSDYFFYTRYKMEYYN